MDTQKRKYAKIDSQNMADDGLILLGLGSFCIDAARALEV